MTVAAFAHLVHSYTGQPVREACPQVVIAAREDTEVVATFLAETDEVLLYAHVGHAVSRLPDECGGDRSQELAIQRDLGRTEAGSWSLHTEGRDAAVTLALRFELQGCSALQLSGAADEFQRRARTWSRVLSRPGSEWAGSGSMWENPIPPFGSDIYLML